MHRHTLLVNKILCLCAAVPGWPSVLLGHGYRILAIERSVRVGGRTVVPDIMLLNGAAGHILVIDCKGGSNVKPDQEGRYARMRLPDILEIARPRPKAGTHTFAYAIEEEHSEKVRAHTGFALIVFGRRAVRAIGDLGHGPLTRELQAGVSLGDEPMPQFFYPFSINDSHRDIDAQVAPILLSRPPVRPNRAAAAEVFRAVHPFHDRYAPAHVAELVEVTRLSMERVLGRRGAAGSARALQEGSA